MGALRKPCGERGVVQLQCWLHEHTRLLLHASPGLLLDAQPRVSVSRSKQPRSVQTRTPATIRRRQTTCNSRSSLWRHKPTDADHKMLDPLQIASRPTGPPALACSCSASSLFREHKKQTAHPTPFPALLCYSAVSPPLPEQATPRHASLRQSRQQTNMVCLHAYG